MVSDMDGKSIIETIRVAETTAKEERNIFTEALIEVRKHKENHEPSIDIYLKEKCKSLQDKLEAATNFYAMKHYAKAVECYGSALAIIETDRYPDEFRLDKDAVFRIKYALALSNVAVNKCGPLITACELLTSLIPVHGNQVPALYYSLAAVNFTLNHYEKSDQALEHGLERLAECADPGEVTFPASNDIIPDTHRLTLRDKMLALRKDCKNPPVPDAKCFYSQCVAESQSIYFSSPRFLGYASVRCSERCKFNYHRSCWKIKLKVDNVKNPAVYLGQPCETSDCTGTVSEVNIFDESLSTVKHIAPKEETPRVHRTKIEKDNSVPGHQNKRDRSRSRTKKREVDGPFEGAQLQMPIQVINESSLKPEAVEFKPKVVTCDVTAKCSTVPLEATTKTEETNEELNAELSNDTPNMHQDAFKLNQSNFKVDAPEFRPEQYDYAHRNSESTEWQTETESTADSCSALDVPNFANDPEHSTPHRNFKADPSAFRPERIVLTDDYIDWNIKVNGWSTNSECAVDGLDETVGSITVPHPVHLSTSAFVKSGDAEHKCVATDPVRMNCMGTQVLVDSTEQSTQTNHVANMEKTNLLKCEIKGLKSLLLGVEDAYNNLLFEHKQFLRMNQVSFVVSSTTSSQTEHPDDIDQKRLENCVNAVHDASTQTTYAADKLGLQGENEKLTDEIEKLEEALELERKCFRERQMQYRQEISSLESSNHDLEQQLAAAQSELAEYKQNNAAADLTRVLKEEVYRCKSFYGSYLNILGHLLEQMLFAANCRYMDKCKRMIWTLDAVKSVCSPVSTPSDSQCIESLGQWNAAFMHAINYNKLISVYDGTFLENIACKAYNNIFQYPVLTEPPDIILRDFQFVVNLNRKLERDMANLMQALMHVPPQQTALLQPTNYPLHNPQPTPEPVYPNEEQSGENWSDIWESMNRAVATGELDTRPTNGSGSAHPSDTSQVPPVKSHKADVTLGAIPKTNHKLVPDKQNTDPPATGQSKQPAELPKKPKVNVAGISALIHKIQDQFPLTSSDVIREAVFSIREQYGSMTGMSSKQILAEVRKYVYAKQRSVTPVQSVWAKVNVPVQWQNEQQDKTCSICLEHMSPGDSVEMSCQHKFHTHCIKQWLQSDSVCPICRSYITLADEYPPLM